MSLSAEERRLLADVERKLEISRSGNTIVFGRISAGAGRIGWGLIDRERECEEARRLGGLSESTTSGSSGR